ncbi:MAG: response regulator transcription factor [Bacteroidetes bacterium]|nr:response regulator transcription factor [Bacteroidota bacterium]
MFNIIIVEDHPIFKDGLKNLLEKEIDFQVTDIVSSTEELLNKLTENKYDIIISDVDLPGRSGIEVLPDMKKMQPKVPVLILSMHSEENTGFRAIKAGADSYLSKEADPSEILKAVRTLLTGRKYITSRLAEKLAFQVSSNSDKKPHELLSNREFEVMRLIALGKTIKEIGDILSLSINTVNTYRNRIFQKMSVSSNIDLAHYVFENDLFD